MESTAVPRAIMRRMSWPEVIFRIALTSTSMYPFADRVLAVPVSSKTIAPVQRMSSSMYVAIVAAAPVVSSSSILTIAMNSVKAAVEGALCAVIQPRIHSTVACSNDWSFAQSVCCTIFLLTGVASTTWLFSSKTVHRLFFGPFEAPRDERRVIAL